MSIFKPKFVFVVLIHSLSGVEISRVYSSEFEALQYCNTFNRVASERYDQFERFCRYIKQELR